MRLWPAGPDDGDVDELTMLALRARNGDRRPLEELIRHGQNDVWRLCAHLVDAASADDLTQETFLRVVRSLPAFRGESSARTWLLTIARRVCADELRGRVRRRRLIGRLGEQGRRIDAADTPAGLCEVESLVAALDPDRRAAFVHTQILGLN